VDASRRTRCTASARESCGQTLNKKKNQSLYKRRIDRGEGAGGKSVLRVGGGVGRRDGAGPARG